MVQRHFLCKEHGINWFLNHFFEKCYYETYVMKVVEYFVANDLNQNYNNVLVFNYILVNLFQF